MIKELNGTGALYRQIATYYEREILAGRLCEGDRLPPTAELAASFQVNLETMQQSLAQLSKRGLIVRRPRSGTFVAKSFASKNIGVIVGKEMFARSDLAFHKMYFSLLIDYFESQGWNCKLYLTTVEDECDAAFYRFKHDVESGEIRGVIEFCTNRPVTEYIDREVRLPKGLHRESAGYSELFARGFAYLYKLGARKVALLAGDTMAPHLDAARKWQERHRDFYFERFPVDSFLSCGYRAAGLALDSGYGFDAIFSGNDAATGGVLYSLLERGVRIPGDIKLLTHANKGIDIFSHIPLTRLELDPMDQIQFKYDEIMAQIEGREFAASPAMPRLIAGKSCGE